MAEIDKTAKINLAEIDKSTIFALYINGYGRVFDIVQAPIYDEIMYIDTDFICAKKDGWHGLARLNSHKDRFILNMK